ncbi:MAG: hypothetical protein ACOCXJ_04020 [Planctomycetota bacterium]
MTGAKPATFACPNCGKTYPVLPSLIDRSVRCNACREPFRLHADGRVELVAPEPDTHTATGTEERTEQARARQMATESSDFATESSDFATEARAAPRSASSVRRRAADPNADARARLAAAAQRVAERTESPEQRQRASGVRRTPQDSSRPIPAGRAQRTSSQNLSAIRKSMSATLSTAAAAAAETVRQDRPAATGPSDRPAASPPSLSNEGMQSARRDLRWLLGLIAMVMVVAAVIWLSSGRGPLEERIAAYAAQVEGTSGAAERVRALRERALLQTIDGIQRPLLLIGHGSTRSQEPLSVDVTAAAGAFAEAGVLIPELALVVAADHVDAVWRLVRGGSAAVDEPAEEDPAFGDFDTQDSAQPGSRGPRSRQELQQRLQAAEIPFRDLMDLHGELAGAVPIDEAVYVLEALVAGTTGPRGENQWRVRLLAGDAPARIDVAVLRGRGAMRLRPQGSAVVEVEELPQYTAVLVRFAGTGWPSDWQVFDVHELDQALREPWPFASRVRQADAYLDNVNAPPEPVLDPAELEQAGADYEQ